ncbi:alpha/beta hydrolase [Streptomyces sp. DSM 3412]|uniref:Alpha/beta hydrolase n=1 Tax=Streptomyces gottesmaniae TaxID=3075518 RepID=A0ABU2YTA4_9ACTN|nr:alpha/beta hydrolase [Streptomyces sp. DSM 3412]MDT0567201.1 alpha/beta hydrolase [Streptomyces sp. DSM 3412]
MPDDHDDDLPDGFARHRITANGTELHTIVGGAGEPVLLLHGWPQTWRAWRHLMRPLADQGYTVIAPDLRGTGRSARADSGYAKDDQAEDMRQLLAALDLPGPVRLVGHDIGGMVAFSYARLYPDLVHRLALIDLAVPGLGLEKAMNPATGGSFHFGLFMTREAPELLLRGNERRFFQWWFPRLSAAPGVFTPEEIDATTASYRGHDALRDGFEHYRTLAEDARVNRAWADSGEELRVPLLAVGGEYNAGIRVADNLRPVAPHVEAAVVKGSGHFVPEERPQALLDELVPFLARQRVRPRSAQS